MKIKICRTVARVEYTLRRSEQNVLRNITWQGGRHTYPYPDHRETGHIGKETIRVSLSTGRFY